MDWSDPANSMTISERAEAALPRMEERSRRLSGLILFGHVCAMAERERRCSAEAERDQMRAQVEAMHGSSAYVQAQEELIERQAHSILSLTKQRDALKATTTLKRAFLAGFRASRGGFNGEYPCHWSDEQLMNDPDDGLQETWDAWLKAEGLD